MLRPGKFLGKFWERLSSSDGFVSGVLSTLSEAAHGESSAQAAWYAGQRLKARKSHACEPVACVLYLRASHLEEKDGTWHPVSDVSGVAPSADSLLAGESELGSESKSEGFVTSSLYPFPTPSRITAHVLDNDVTLFQGLDYEWTGQEVLFHANPESFGFPQVTMTGQSGLPMVCYRVFGWVPGPGFDFDPLSLGEPEGLQWAWETAWDMHQNGASLLSVKKLLAGTCGASVAEADGIVLSVWNEQDTPNVLVGDRLYSGRPGQDCRVVPGDDVRTGDVLFGQLDVCTGADPFPPGLYGNLEVMTDAGPLIAEDRELNSIALPDIGERVLPLTGDPDRVAAYRDRCRELLTAPGIPRLEPGIPAVVNPMRFIAGTLRGAWQLLIRVENPDPDRLQAALACIRRNMKAGSMLSVLVAPAGSVPALSDFGRSASVEVRELEEAQ